MHYPVATAAQLRAVLRALRKSRGLSQEDVSQLLGVNQQRAARIENQPGVTSFDQISRLVAALGGRLVVEDSATTAGAKPAKRSKSVDQDNW